MKMRKAVLALAALALAIAVVPLAAAGVDRKGPPASKTAEIQILGLNDFHGAL